MTVQLFAEVQLLCSANRRATAERTTFMVHVTASIFCYIHVNTCRFSPTFRKNKLPQSQSVSFLLVVNLCYSSIFWVYQTIRRHKLRNWHNLYRNDCMNKKSHEILDSHGAVCNTFVTIYQTARCHFSGDSNLHSHSFQKHQDSQRTWY